jgi:hypothetical protein
VGWSAEEYTTWQTDELVGIRKEVSGFILGSEKWVGKGKLCTVLYYKGKNWDNVGLMGNTFVNSGVGILQSSCINIKTDCVNVNWVFVVSAGGVMFC